MKASKKSPPKQVTSNSKIKIHQKKSLVFLLLAAVLTVVAAAFFVAQNRDESDSPSREAASSTREISTHCTESQNVRMCIVAPSNEINQDDDVSLDVNIRNLSRERLEDMSNNTCTDPYITLNDQYLAPAQACGDALTPVTLNPRRSKSYMLPVPTRSLEEGENIIKVLWFFGLESDEIAITMSKNPDASDE